VYSQSSSCSYYDRVRRQFTRTNMDLRGIPSVWDLEDIVAFGQQIKVCGSGSFNATFYVVSND